MPCSRRRSTRPACTCSNGVSPQRSRSAAGHRRQDGRAAASSRRWRCWPTTSAAHPQPSEHHDCASAHEVFVEAPARLHFGVLDLRGELGRWFGGIGAAAPQATLLVSASKALTVTGQGPDAAARRGVREALPRPSPHPGGRAICVHRALPPHAGLGSGTQLALAVARALAELYGLDADPPVAGAGCRPRARARRSAPGSFPAAAWSSRAAGTPGSTTAGRCSPACRSRLSGAASLPCPAARA